MEPTVWICAFVFLNIASGANSQNWENGSLYSPESVNNSDVASTTVDKIVEMSENVTVPTVPTSTFVHNNGDNVNPIGNETTFNVTVTNFTYPPSQTTTIPHLTVTNFTYLPSQTTTIPHLTVTSDSNVQENVANVTKNAMVERTTQEIAESTFQTSLENPIKHLATVSTLPVPGSTRKNSESTTTPPNLITTLFVDVTTTQLSQTTASSTTDAVTVRIEDLTTTEILTSSSTTDVMSTSTTASVVVETVKDFDELSELEFFNTVSVILEIPPSILWYERDSEILRKAVACVLNSYSALPRIGNPQNFIAEDIVVVQPSPRTVEKKLIVCFFARNSTESVVNRKFIVAALREFRENFEAWAGTNVIDFYGGIRISFLVTPRPEDSSSNIFERNYLLIVISTVTAISCVLSLLFAFIYKNHCRTVAARQTDVERSSKNCKTDKVCLTNGADDRKSTISTTEEEGWVFPYEQFLSMGRESNADDTRL